MNPRSDLESKTTDELHIIARKLKVRGRSKLTARNELIRAILKYDDTAVRQAAAISWCDRYRDWCVGFAGLGCLRAFLIYLTPTSSFRIGNGAPIAPNQVLQQTWAAFTVDRSSKMT